MGAKERTHPLVETMAAHLFLAENGHTGMTWDSYARGDDNTDYHRTVRRLLEAFWNPDKPFVVFDLDGDKMWLESRS